MDGKVESAETGEAGRSPLRVFISAAIGLFSEEEPLWLLKNASVLQMAAVLNMATVFVQSVVVARSLGLDGFGQVALVTALVGLLFQVCDFRPFEMIVVFGAAFLQKKDLSSARSVVKLGLITALISGAAAFVLCAAAAWPVAHLVWKRSHLAAAIVLLAIGSICSRPVPITFAVLRLVDSFGLLAGLRSAISVLNLLVVSAAALLDAGVVGMIAAYAACHIASLAVCLPVLAAVPPSRLGGRLRDTHLAAAGEGWPEMRHYMKMSWVSNSSMLATWQLDELILGCVVPAGAVALYRLAKGLVRMGLSFTDSLLETAQAQISRLWAERSLRQIRRIAVFFLLIGGGLSALAIGAAILFGKMAIRIIYGDVYVGAYGLLVLLMANFICIPFIWIFPLLRAAGRISVIVRAEIASIAVSLALMLVLGSAWGTTGVAIGQVMRDVLIVTATVWFVLAERRVLLEEA